MREIQLTRGKVAIVDDEDYQRITQHKWHYGDGYAVRGNYGRRPTLIYMHREIANDPDGKQVDHINGNKLDNRKCNLRVCEEWQNRVNVKSNNHKKGEYRGVWIRGKKWQSSIGWNGKEIFLGTFDTPEAAALAYNEAAKKYHGEFAQLNIVRGCC